MAHECLGGVEVVALGAGNASREEGVPAVWPLVAAALVTTDTVPCKQSFISRGWEMRIVFHGYGMVWVTVKTSAANRLIGEVVQSRRRPLLGPSPG